MGTQYIHRTLEKRLIKLFNNFPVVILSGARQVGKSTILEHTFPDIPSVVFDPILDIENARSDPDLFLQNRKPPIILDEIQYVPELVPTIKRYLDKNRSKKQFLITGSQQWEVMKSLSESLAGRAVFLDLEGFNILETSREKPQSSWLHKWLTDSEKLDATSIETLTMPYAPFETIWRGNLPETFFLDQDLISIFFKGYERTYIERDVRLISEVSDLSQFSRFYKLCAALTAKEINFSELGREIGLNPQTAQRWIDILKATFQWIEIPAYSGNTIKRISLKPKGYLTDTGLICFCLAIPSPETLGSHPLWGFIFETAVILEIFRQSRLLPTQPNFYHWRSHGGAEVDLILEYAGHYFPIEIKGTTKPTKQDGRGIASFRKTYPNLNIQKGLIVSLTDTFYHLAQDLSAMPWNGY